MSTATKWTPGPWSIDTSDGNWHIRSADGDSLMCDEQYYPWTPKNPADWHLIAAAPELFEALEGALECSTDPIRWADSKSSEHGSKLGFFLTAAQVKQIVAALAKARGEQ